MRYPRVLGSCACLYCKGKSPEDVIASQNNKLHFLHYIHMELDLLTSKNDMKVYFLKRLDDAIENYRKLTHVFKKEEYGYLQIWKNVFNRLN